MVLNVIAVHKNNSLLKETKLAVIALDIVYKAVLWPQEDAKGPNKFYLVWYKNGENTVNLKSYW